jgi:hypothetical protein
MKIIELICIAIMAFKFGITEEINTSSKKISDIFDSDFAVDFNNSEFDNRTSNFREGRAKDMRTNRKILKGIESTLSEFIKNQKIMSSKYEQNLTKLINKTDKIAKEFKNLTQVYNQMASQKIENRESKLYYTNQEKFENLTKIYNKINGLIENQNHYDDIKVLGNFLNHSKDLNFTKLKKYRGV